MDVNLARVLVESSLYRNRFHIELDLIMFQLGICINKNQLGGETNVSFIGEGRRSEPGLYHSNRPDRDGWSM